MEANEATSIIFEEAGPGANIIFGAVIDPELNEEIRVTVIATGFNIPKVVTKADNFNPQTESHTPTSSHTRELQDRVNKPLHVQKDVVTEESAEEIAKPKPVLTFDDTDDSPVIYGQDLQIPAFIRRQHD
jgi:cell division protein FtsZ